MMGEGTGSDAVRMREPGFRASLRLNEIDREMERLRGRLHVLEAQKARLMTRLLTNLVAPHLAPTAPDRPGASSRGKTSRPETPSDRRAGYAISPGGRFRIPAARKDGRHEGDAKGCERPVVDAVMAGPSCDHAPRGFAHLIRQIAYRSIVEAGHPLERGKIVDAVVASGTGLPVKNLDLKVSKILTMDPNLTNERGSGYSLTMEARRRYVAQLDAGATFEALQGGEARIDPDVDETLCTQPTF